MQTILARRSGPSRSTAVAVAALRIPSLSRIGARLPAPSTTATRREVARDLIGKVLVHLDGETSRAARIVETEAYHGPRDQASHARFGPTRGRR